MTVAIDLSLLPGPAQKILDPAGPPPLKAMAAKGVVPGLKPGDILAVVIVLSQGTDTVAETARQTLEKLPPPLVNGALGAELQPGVLDVLGPIYAKDAAVSEKVLNHPAILPATVAAMAGVASEGVCEIIATNEERLIAHPEIIEKLYLNKNARMSTADRILELAVRHDLELKIPAFEQAKIAIQGELIAEPTEEPNFDDVLFSDARKSAEALELAEGEDTHKLNEETGQEEVVKEAKPLHALWTELKAPQKIRMLLLENKKEVRLLGIRDANPQVAVTALSAPGINDAEIERIAKLRSVSEEVLREIAMNKEWTRHYNVKKALVMNPRTPFGQAAKWIMHLYESDLKAISRSRDVSGAVQTAAKQQLQRKGK